jgi:hypothetical protein
MASSSNNATEDNIGKAVDLVIAGKMSLERFKKVMPRAYAGLRGGVGGGDISVDFLNQVMEVAKSKLVQHPELIETQEIRYRFPELPEARALFSTIVKYAAFAGGTDQVAFLTLNKSYPYMPT